LEKIAAEVANATLSPTRDFVLVAALQLRTSPVETQYKSEAEATEKKLREA
jgi:hypothetical protein